MIPNPKKDSLSYEVLWNQFRAGDLNALEVIYRDHFKTLYQHGMTICASQDLVKDAIQELFTFLVQRQYTLTSVENVSFYLLKSLRNKIYDELNSRKKTVIANEAYKNEVLVDLVGEEIKIPEGTTQNKEQLVLVINQLPERQREIIMLIFFEGRSYEEVSKLMSMTVNSAYKLTWKAVNSLKKSLRQLK